MAVAGVVGVLFYGYSSYKIGEKLGKWSAPYFAVYVVLLIAAIAPAAGSEPITSPLAILMSVVSWVLYSHLVVRHRIVGSIMPVRVAAVVIGLLALVVFPLLPEAAAVFALLHRTGAVTGWLVGVRASGKDRPAQPTPPTPPAAT